MDNRYITVTSSNQHPCQFVSNFTDAIALNDGYEVAVTRIFHGPLYNVTEKNNKFSLIRVKEIVDYKIPIGFYESTCHILGAIYTVLIESIGDESKRTLIKKNPAFRYKASGESSMLNLEDKDVNFIVDTKRDDDALLLHLLGYSVSARFNRIDINHFSLESTIEAGFLYSNIVANSIIDQQQSRLLACLPIASRAGYNYHEVQNPIYFPLSVHSFTDIDFAMTNVRGEILEMDNMYSTYWGKSYSVIYPTVLTLHIRKIYK